MSDWKSRAKPASADWKSRAMASPQAPAENEGGGAGMAALESFGNSAAMGYLPQAQAALEAPMAWIGDKLTGSDVYDNLPSYVERRDQHIARQEAQNKAHPGAALAGGAAGALASAALPGGAIAKGMKGASAAAKIGAGALQGAATGALYNPGDEKGVVDPLQAGPRAANAALGAGVGGLMSGVGAGVSRLAEKHRMIDRVKDSANLSKSVKQEIDQALAGVTEKQIKPRADQLQELLQGKSVEIAPDRIKGVSPGLDKLAELMAERRGVNGRTEISANRANRLKRVLDGRANYAASKPFAESAVVKGGETAKKGADILRGKLADLDPQVGKLNDEMAEAIRLRADLAKNSQSRPIASIRGEPGTDAGSKIDAIDKMADSNLETLSNDIGWARENLFKPANLFKPLEAPGELRKAVVRGAGRGARMAEPATSPTSLQAILQAMYELKR